MEKKKILVIASHNASLFYFRGDFIKLLIQHNYEVFTAAPGYEDDIENKLRAIGAQPLVYALGRTNINPFNDLKSIKQLKQLIKDHAIDLVFPYTIKPVIYGSIAANACKVPVISLITGLGFSFTGLTFKARVLQRLNEFLYKISIRKNKYIVFQNRDDYQLFLERGVITKEQPVGFVSGSGVNLNEYRQKSYDSTKNEIRFLLAARLIKEKGVAYYINAAKHLKSKYPDTAFHIIGEPDGSLNAINFDEIQALHDTGIIVYHGWQNNVPDHLNYCDVFVLPTYYREGVPRSILEALAVGLPIITTDTPGCKETVLKDKNGILIEPRNLEALINAMEFFIKTPDRIRAYGEHSRTYAEERFDVTIINNDLITLINEVIT